MVRPGVPSTISPDSRPTIPRSRETGSDRPWHCSLVQQKLRIMRLRRAASIGYRRPIGAIAFAWHGALVPGVIRQQSSRPELCGSSRLVARIRIYCRASREANPVPVCATAAGNVQVISVRLRLTKTTRNILAPSRVLQELREVLRRGDAPPNDAELICLLVECLDRGAIPVEAIGMKIGAHQSLGFFQLCVEPRRTVRERSLCLV